MPVVQKTSDCQVAEALAGAVIARMADSPVIQLSSRDPSHGKPDGGSTTGPTAQPKSLRALYPANGVNAVELTEKELVRLNEGEMANDSVIDFFLKLTYAVLPPYKQDQIHFFHSFS
ncbi:hypothetical protein WJX84_002832 [Apatococcus fuscideae]|uniref:Uncharacterized protein n=1 Tax=Apatococcus fuscideae TaxID=2026836 RepID=A0AAW1T4X9_9CHLO